MKQQTNQNIFQLKQTNIWGSKWLEIKRTESSMYCHKDLAIWKFIYKFFKNLNIFVNKCNLFHLNQIFQIFISSHLDAQHFYKQNHILFKWNKLYYKININHFLDKLFVSLINFQKKKFSYFLIIQKLKNNYKNFVTKQIKQLLKKKLTNLRKFKQFQYFEKSINLLILSINTKNSHKLIAKLISNILKNLKHHNFFIRFIQTTLKILTISPISKVKRIKINIKGRLNGQSRARNKQININKNVYLFSLNCKINYFNEIAFTPNGTIGIKIWTYDL